MSDETKTDNIEKPKSKEERIVDFIKAWATVDAEMVPFREHRKDMKTSYVENDWLTKDEIKAAIRAYNLLKAKVDIDQIQDFYDQIKKSCGIGG